MTETWSDLKTALSHRPLSRIQVEEEFFIFSSSQEQSEWDESTGEYAMTFPTMLL